MEANPRQSKLVEVGEAGQARIALGSADVLLAGIAAEVCTRYLAGCGVGTLRVRDERLVGIARTASGSITVIVVPDLPVYEGASSFDLRDPVAKEVARGANEALRIVKSILNGRPWILGNLSAYRSVIATVDREAQDAYFRNEESCGLLVGPVSDPRHIDGVVPMVNRAGALHRLDPEAYPRTARTYFDIDSLKFQAALSRGDKEGRPVKVLYHSHVDAEAYFSATDAEVAKMGRDEPPWALAYLVTSVQKGEISGRALFIWDSDAKAFVESPLTIVED